MKKRVEHPWYSYDKALSFNAYINMIVGMRGNGKTFGAKKLVIRKFLKNGEQFVLLRRFEKELSTRQTFFADIADDFPDYDFRIHGRTAQCSPVSAREDKKRIWDTMGYFVALTGAQKLKGSSFHKVTSIIFDEFILEKGMLHYLPDEVVTFLNFYSTVDRGQDKTRVFMLANSVSISNPYFLYWKIRPDQLPEYSTHMDGAILTHFIDSKDFSDSIYETRFGKLIAGTEYASYAVDNEFGDAHDALVKEKTQHAKYMYSLETGEGTFSIWYDVALSEYYALQRKAKREKLITLNIDSMDEGKLLLSRTSTTITALRTAFNHGRLYFDSPLTRNQFAEVFKR